MKNFANPRKFHYPVMKSGQQIPCTIIIPTRKRCPEPMDQMYLNPLSQCLESIIYQKNKPGQVIVSAARESDYTREVLEHYSQVFTQKQIEFHVRWVNDQIGLGPLGKIIRAFDLVKYEIIHLLEDDSVLHPDTLAGAVEIMKDLRSHIKKVGIMALPLFRRASHPTKFLSFSEICQINQKLRLTGCHESVFPLELLQKNNKRYLFKEKYLLHPIDFFRGGNNLISKAALGKIGNLPLATPYGWEVCVGIHLKQNGYKSFFTPYLNLGAMHSFYGARWMRKKFSGDDWTNNIKDYHGLSLPEIVKNAASGKTQTGLGLFHKYVYYFRVASCYTQILRKYSPQFLELWLKKLEKSFVARLKSDLTENRQKIFKYRHRESIYLTALQTVVEKINWLPDNEILTRIHGSSLLKKKVRQDKIYTLKEIILRSPLE